ncbi:MAG: tRNA epoxyqueuosine(34) reductase QueG [Nitrospinae bacterium]|nr:tRNA epoxyqueuosine(34) reductase QueG [Nitrospinota bacterium]
MDDRSAFTQQIKAKAQALGFDLVGMTTAEPLPHADRYRAWLAQGFAGEMGYMTRNVEKRADPSRVLPGVRSIIVLGMNYHTAPELPKDARLRGWISEYAWGHDYHAFLGKQLEALAGFIRDSAGPAVQARWYVDTGPILEREVAWRAGLGWPGKNTTLINRGLGSWLFLGVILLDMELAYDAPATAHCGTCTRCLDACPTGAFVGPGVLDARRCISYLTIELRGPIPRELRPLMGTHIFGCDICQAVCPWNRKAPATAHAVFWPRAGYAAPELIPLLDLSEEDFRRQFRDSPIWRAKRRGFLRNVAVALGNLRDPRAIPALALALRDPEPLIRGHVAWALGRMGGMATQPILHAALATECDAEVREEIICALGEIAGEDEGPYRVSKICHDISIQHLNGKSGWSRM